MGICCCKSHDNFSEDHLDGDSVEGRRPSRRLFLLRRITSDHPTDGLVLEALSALRKLADNDEEAPECMQFLHCYAEEEDGWLTIVKSCIFAIPLEDSLGTAVLSFLLDECPLPTRDGINALVTKLDLSKDTDYLKFYTKADKRESPLKPAICRNLAVVLACLADKLAGPMSVALLSKGTLEFLLERLKVSEHPAVILFSILALEKFAQTSENMKHIKESSVADELMKLEEEFLHSSNLLEHQAGFCAQWCLDNSFPKPSRPFSYENVDVSYIKAMLNTNDVSEYLKISPTGLEARCDAASFESVRCTFCVESGVWFYEVYLLTAGVMQIGWATKESKFLNHEGYGIGDDEYSYAYDGCRQLIWHNAKSHPHNHPPWKPGDVLGLLLDLDKRKIQFLLNGGAIEKDFKAKKSRSGFFAAASFMSFQHCIFNFGAEPFRYPPLVAFKCFNDHAILKEEDKVILPKHIKMAAMRQESVSGEPCKICFEKASDTKLLPCHHGDLCKTCALRMEQCPICRQSISGMVQVEQELEPESPTK